MKIPKSPRARLGGLLARTALCVAVSAIARPMRATQAPADSGQIRDLVQSIREQILRNDGRLAARRAELDRAKATLAGAGSRGPASLFVQAEEVPNGLALDQANTRIGLEQRLPNTALRGGQRAAAQSEIDIAEARLGAVARESDARLRGTLSRLVGWSIIKARIAAEDSLLASVEQATTTRFSTGDARYVDVLRLRTERLRARADMADAVKEVAGARSTILRLAGAGVVGMLDSLLSLGTKQPSMNVVLALRPETSFSQPSDTSALSSFADSALRTRVAGFESQHAEAERRVAQSATRPDFDLSLAVQRFSNGSGFTVGPAVGVSMSLPFTARTQTRSAVAAATAGVQSARATQSAVRRQLTADLAVISARYDAASERLALFDGALHRGARDEREAALSSYRTGAMTLLELMDFERALARADIDRVRASMDVVDASVDFVAALTTE